MLTIEDFIQHLQTYHRPGVFNPWVDYDPELDFAPEAPRIRSANLKRYLELRTAAHYIFMAEGLGYQGGHFTGMAMTSERILLGHHPAIRPEEVLGTWNYQRTSRAASPLLKSTQRELGFNEPTATIMWESLHEHHLAVREAVLWNIFPFHPYKAGNLLSNRTPSREELDEGLVYARELLELLPGCRILAAIGRKSAETLRRYGIACQAVPHPSMGGANRFRAALAVLLAAEERST